MMHMSAALPLALAGAEQRARLLDGIGAALDGVRHRLPRQAASDAGVEPAIALRQHDMLRGWLRSLAGALRADAADERQRTVPLGPVAAVGAHGSAYGLAGIYAMAALAAGCPVLARAAPAPSCTELAELIAAAAAAVQLPHTLFELADDDDALLSRRAVRGVICRAGARPVPRLLPALAELDGTEAAFVLPCALNGRAEFLGRQLLAQPGACPVVVAIDGDGFIDLREAIIDRLADGGDTCTGRPADAALPPGSDARLLGDAREGQAAVFAEVPAAALLAAPHLCSARRAGLLVRCADARELLALAWALGPLACASLHVAAGDAALSAHVLPALELAARHIHVNRFGSALRPTPAAALDAIGRFRRPVFHHAEGAHAN
ncbi:aldehyde dehydrogenase family protein [Pseudoduganella umbonata]|uniref:Aldehyde dehydrogenase family protein n=1 Tax=Pseudoduganella umbonata TaxID=864828 RepID=A0A4P8HQS9_9BURK|nr:aldehyde dehydrogenase family protein [Pseudoduganella umbonata]MBB3222545.1 NADP-dependent aldehyde dehydrogenase [Pseudoduganella umbonata]QCP10928.1 aldehyde dehydrogenase family protein [Pseudoduganella umbonata]